MTKTTFFITALIAAFLLNVPMRAQTALGHHHPDHSEHVLFGHVIDKRTGEYLAGAKVGIAGGHQFTFTDSTGHYRLPDVPSEIFSIEATYNGYYLAKHRVRASEARIREVNFELMRNDVALGDVVVSASRTETLRRNAPVLVGVVSQATMENTSSVNLAQSLNYQTGLRVENNCQNCGFTQVRINGLDGNYSQILINSRPVFSALTGVYGLEMLPTNMRDRVEIVRGGGSALFGGSAIAGIINVITKDPSYNSASFGHSLGVYGGSNAFENITSFNASVVSSNRRMGVALYGQNREHKPYDHDDDGFTEKPKTKDQALGLRSFFKLTNFQKLNLEYHHLEEFRRGGDNLHLPPHMAEIAEQARYNVNSGAATYTFRTPNAKHSGEVYLSATNSDRESFYGGSGTPEAYGRTHNLTSVAGGQYTYNAAKLLFAPSQVVAGVEYKYDYLTDKTVDNRGNIDQTTRVASIFAQNEWRTPLADILIGARLDKHSVISNAIFSPRVNVKFKPIDDLSLRLTYASGFRAPQAFDEDLHVGVVQGEPVVIRNSSDLKEERSHSLSASLDYYTDLSDDWKANFVVEGFYTYLKDAFAIEDDPNGGTALAEYKVRVNKNSAKVYGAMAEVRIDYRDLFQWQSGFTLQSAKYGEDVDVLDDGQGNVVASRNIMRTPGAYGYFTATYNPTPVWKIALSGIYTGPMDVPHEGRNEIIRSKSFFELGLRLSRTFNLFDSADVEVYAAAKNLFNAFQDDFDKGAERVSTYVYGPSDPRSFLIGFKVSF